VGLRIRLPAQSIPVQILVDASDCGGDGKYFLFADGRLIPVYYAYPSERRGYVLQAGGASHGALPNIEGDYEILLAVRGREVARLQKAIRKLREEVGALEEIPHGFWARLGTLVAQRSFCLLMVKELYLVMMQRQALLQKLDAAVEPLRRLPQDRL
jgi:hypothetical protein